MSTLPFLLSVADELDNINSQSYMDDFGLGFHPHRQYYRTPTIQLSLPAGTEWMQDERQRYRTHKFVDESQNNLQTAPDEAEEDETGNGASTSTAAAVNRQKFTSALNSNGEEIAEDDDNIDNSVKMYNLSKKCCKQYHRHGKQGRHTDDAHSAKPKCNTESTGGGYRLHPKCMEGNNSSSDESLQKVSSSIEFLTCFLLKKTRARDAKHSSSGSATSGSDSGGKKS